MLAENVMFAALAAAMIVGAVKVVTTQNVVRAALYLVTVLGGAAAIFILLAAEFVAVVQVLVYIGAIVVLFLFGIMLTRAPLGRDVDLDNDQRWLGALAAVVLLAVLTSVLRSGFAGDKIAFGPILRAGPVGDSILGAYVVPFEVVSVLLLAALVGAVALARKD